MEWRNLRLKSIAPILAQSKPACRAHARMSPPRMPPETPTIAPSRGRLLVVSHPSVVSVNQEVYRELMQRGWDLEIVLPSRWRSEYDQRDFAPQVLPGMERRWCATRVALRGYPQRHFYLARCRAIAARFRPDVAFVEAEPFSFAATQWSLALGRLGVPFGVQCAENIDRSLPLPVRLMRTRVLRRAAFVAARSDSAVRLARAWGARGEVELAPHAVPGWDELPEPSPGSRPFTVGYAGRLVPSKGLTDLLAAVRRLQAPVELLLIGDGELRGELEGQAIPGSKVRVLDDLSHQQMAAGYAQLDVLGVAVADDADVEGAVRARDRRGAVVRRAGRRLGLGRDPVADRADRRRAGVPRGRRRGAGRAAASGCARTRRCAHGSPRRAGRRSSGCSRSRAATDPLERTDRARRGEPASARTARGARCTIASQLKRERGLARAARRGARAARHRRRACAGARRSAPDRGRSGSRSRRRASARARR